ncbi:hypothetical protein FSP39_019504 [Pinctada imbricata]|uniref:Uncharacterized protein n=1 Tax=Pinctada imbricata TaxID=66713 RepID=A0AA88Y027_PINIB|nr:hypothetical protein FSP39_019504 [Pinctada imbricata]
MGNRCRLWTAICHASSKWCGYPGLRAHNPLTSPIFLRYRRTYSCGVKQPPHCKLMDSYCLKNLSYATEDCLAYRATNSMYTSYPGWDHTIDNFLRIVIYYEDLNYQLITEEPLYSIYRFIADIGGTLGLFIGASLVSVMELLQVALAVINYLCKKLCCRHGVNRVNRFHSK